MQRKIVKLLYRYDSHKDLKQDQRREIALEGVSAKEFIHYVRFNKKFKRSFVLYYNQKTMTERNIELAHFDRKKIQESIQGSIADGFIKIVKTAHNINTGEHQSYLYVLPEGRRFIKWGYFINIFLKRYGEIKSIILAIVLSSVFWIFIGWLKNLKQ